MLALDNSSAAPQPNQLRPIDVHRDLNAIADLIETCFEASMDADGKEYLRQLRRMARDISYLRWASSLAERGGMPLNGYVWEEQGQVVGNLSLVPITRSGRRTYLIANVAVRPDYRRRGIARALTQAAVNYAQSHGAWSAWLQVREDNPGALNLYQELGFKERARRTTWLSSPNPPPVPPVPGVSIHARTSAHWPYQEHWLKQIYPETVTWNLPITLKKYRPSFLNHLSLFLNGEIIRHWTAMENGRPIGMATWQPSPVSADNLWLATTPEFEEKALLALLPYVRRALRSAKPLSINYPGGRADSIFETAGFRNHLVLLWMEKPFHTA